MYPQVEDMSEIYARHLPRVNAIFLFAIEYSAKAQHNNRGTPPHPIYCKNARRIPRRTTLIWSKHMPILCQEYMLFSGLPLSSQPRLKLLRPLSISQHISAYKKNKGGSLLAEDGHIFLTCLQLVGTWVKHIFRNLVPYLVTCPQLVRT